MAGNEPMSEQTLTMIRELLAYDGRQWGDYPQQELFRVCWSAQLLLAEVERLRTEVAAMRPMVQDVVDGCTMAMTPNGKRCWCATCLCIDETDGDDWSSSPHDDNCTVTQARAYLAAHPAAGEG